MHMTIIFGAIIMAVLTAAGLDFTLPVLVLFLVLKLFADIHMHIQKHAGQKEPKVHEN